MCFAYRRMQKRMYVFHHLKDCMYFPVEFIRVELNSSELNSSEFLLLCQTFTMLASLYLTVGVLGKCKQ